MSQKKWKFNVIDIIAVVLILAVGVFLASKFAGGESSGVEMVDIRYTVRCENQSAEIYESVQKYIPSALMASGSLYNAQVVSVEAEPTLICSGGTWVADPTHMDLTFVVEGQVEKAAVLVPTLAAQEIRIGKEIILKTEYMEFDPAVVIDVEYP